MATCFYKSNSFYYISCNAYLEKYLRSTFAMSFSIVHVVVVIFTMGFALLPVTLVLAEFTPDLR